MKNPIVVVIRGGIVENVAADDVQDVVIVDYDRDPEAGDVAYYEKPIKYTDLHPDTIEWVGRVL